MVRDVREAHQARSAAVAGQNEIVAGETEHVLNVQAVEMRTGICTETLRTWERRYGWPRPRRMANGYRAYSEDDVALVLAVKREMERGAPAATAWHQVLAGKPRCTPCPSIRSPEWLGNALLAALLEFDTEGALAQLAEAHALYPLEHVLARIIQPVMVTIGAHWKAGEATVAQEHFATELIRDSLALMGRAYRPSHGAETVLVGAGPSEWHDIGALTVSLLLRRGGHHVVYLGQNLAVEGLEQAITRTGARMLLLSATRAETAAALAEVPATLKDMAAPPLFVFGGRAFAEQPDLAARIDGIYLPGDAATAAGCLDQLIAAQG